VAKTNISIGIGRLPMLTVVVTGSVVVLSVMAGLG
jgi:hypothetical protein